jgi:formylglycine-generating enzyme required for sulfatase activity
LTASPSARRTLAAALLLAAVSARAAAPRRVAVLEFTAAWSGQCAPAPKPAVAERCQTLLLLTDEARAGALEQLRPPAYLVMTRENTAELLKQGGPAGGACSEGECEVETARLVGADLVVSGQVTLLEGTWIASVKLHDVRSAALLGATRARGRSQLQLVDALKREVEALVGKALGGVPGAEPGGPPPAKPAVWAPAAGPGRTPAPATPELKRATAEADPRGMILLPGGSYGMGTTGAYVSVSPFFLDATEVTAGEYAACVKAGGCTEPDVGGRFTYGAAGMEDHPVNGVDWGQAVAFCGWKGKRLPAEEEWEWAARGAARGTTYPWGSEPPAGQLCRGAGTCAVGSFPAGDSPQGVKDLAGNVAEWTSTAYGLSARIYRGGSWFSSDDAEAAASFRDWAAPERRAGYRGFRCARDR